MTILVEDSRDVTPFLANLQPAMELARDNIPNPEFREVSTALLHEHAA